MRSERLQSWNVIIHLNKKAGIICFFLFTSVLGAAQCIHDNPKIIFKDDFSGTSLSKDWIVETSESSGYSVGNGKLELNTKDGITVWYRYKLSGNYAIEFDRTVVMDGGPNDRLSDLNQFWNVTDPANKLFTRKGSFREYDSLQMYYAGFGGNYNTTTRMRRYDGKGELKIIGEFTDSVHLLKPNRTYHIKIEVRNGVTNFFVDGIAFFTFKDDRPFKEGYFAFRSTRSRQWIDNVIIFTLDEG